MSKTHRSIDVFLRICVSGEEEWNTSETIPLELLVESDGVPAIPTIEISAPREVAAALGHIFSKSPAFLGINNEDNTILCRVIVDMTKLTRSSDG